jgi:2'-5' RNA ligase
LSAARARLFVALELPAAAKTAVVDFRDAALGSVAGLRFMEGNALHVTLCFLGSCPPQEIGAIAGACGSLARTGPPGLTLGEAIWLPVRRPSVVAVTIADAVGALAQLQAALARALSSGGWYEPDARPYLPHVTIARVRRGPRVRPIDLPAPEPVSLDGAPVTLFRSRLGGASPRYEPLT